MRSSSEPTTRDASKVLGGDLTGRQARRRGLTGSRTASTPAAPAEVALIVPMRRARFDSLELSALVQSVIVTPDRARTAEEFAAPRPGLAADAVLSSPFMLLGTQPPPPVNVRHRHALQAMAAPLHR